MDFSLISSYFPSLFLLLIRRAHATSHSLIVVVCDHVHVVELFETMWGSVWLCVCLNLLHYGSICTVCSQKRICSRICTCLNTIDPFNWATFQFFLLFSLCSSSSFLVLLLFLLFHCCCIWCGYLCCCCFCQEHSFESVVFSLSLLLSVFQAPTVFVVENSQLMLANTVGVDPTSFSLWTIWKW